MDFDFFGFLINTLLFVTALFLILLVLVQRGRGGGLAGALGGMGGQSAFGTKAGDVFTRITIVTAAVWIVLCALAVKYHLPEKEERAFSGIEAAPGAAPIPQAGAPAVPAAQPTATAPAATGDADSTAPPSATPGAAEAPASPAPAAPAPAATPAVP